MKRASSTHTEVAAEVQCKFANSKKLARIEISSFCRQQFADKFANR